jgi:hypothetical protein
MAMQKDGQPLPHRDVSTTRLHGKLDTTSQVTSKVQQQANLAPSPWWS